MLQWFNKLPNSLLMQAENTRLEKILPTILGEHLLQIGGPNEFSLASPIRHKFYMTHDVTASRSLSKTTNNIAADCLQLPIYPQTLDVCLLAHMLEFLSHPIKLLEQIYQALVPLGQLIIIGFNPWSLWGFMHLWKNHSEKPWQGRFYSLYQVKHWLRDQQFQIIYSETFFFRPPSHHPQRDNHLLWLEAAGQICLPGCGSVYIICAQKREEGLTPIKLSSLNLKLALNNQCIKPINPIN